MSFSEFSMNGYELYILNSSLKCRCDLVFSLTGVLYFSNYPVGYVCGVYLEVLREFLDTEVF